MTKRTFTLNPESTPSTLGSERYHGWTFLRWRIPSEALGVGRTPRGEHFPLSARDVWERVRGTIPARRVSEFLLADRVLLTDRDNKVLCVLQPTGIERRDPIYDGEVRRLTAEAMHSGPVDLFIDLIDPIAPDDRANFVTAVMV